MENNDKAKQVDADNKRAFGGSPEERKKRFQQRIEDEEKAR